jgi:hypothetical protein
MNQNTAKRRMIACLDCGASVREDLLAEHMTRCKQQSPAASGNSHKPAGSVAQSQPIQPPAKQRKRYQMVVCPNCGTRFLERHYALHLELCGSATQQHKAPSAPQHNAPSARKPKPTLPKTKEGYTTKSCSGCGYRVCLVPDGGLFQVFDIIHNHRSSVPHQCSGSESEWRRTKLAYVNQKVGIIAQIGRKRGTRKR